jgi:hypothetical protein
MYGEFKELGREQLCHILWMWGRDTVAFAFGFWDTPQETSSRPRFKTRYLLNKPGRLWDSAVGIATGYGLND